MRGKTVNMKVRGKLGERNVNVRAGQPAAPPRLQRAIKKRSTPVDDPLLRVKEYAYDGSIGPTANKDIDSTVCSV